MSNKLDFVHFRGLNPGHCGIETTIRGFSRIPPHSLLSEPPRVSRRTVVHDLGVKPQRGSTLGHDVLAYSRRDVLSMDERGRGRKDDQD